MDNTFKYGSVIHIFLIFASGIHALVMIFFYISWARFKFFDDYPWLVSPLKLPCLLVVRLRF